MMGILLRPGAFHLMREENPAPICHRSIHHQLERSNGDMETELEKGRKEWSIHTPKDQSHHLEEQDDPSLKQRY